MAFKGVSTTDRVDLPLPHKCSKRRLHPSHLSSWEICSAFMCSIWWIFLYRHILALRKASSYIKQSGAERTDAANASRQSSGGTAQPWPVAQTATAVVTLCITFTPTPDSYSRTRQSCWRPILAHSSPTSLTLCITPNSQAPQACYSSPGTRFGRRMQCWAT